MDCTTRKENIKKENIKKIWLLAACMLLVATHKVTGEATFDSTKNVGVTPDNACVSSASPEHGGNENTGHSPINSKKDSAQTKVNNKVQTDEERFLQGNSFYQQREYVQALSCYEAIKHKGRAVFYNRGNCFYYMHKPLEAFVDWCRARKGATYKEYDASVGACCALKEELSSGAYDSQSARVGSTTQGMLSMGSFFERLYTPISLFALQILFACLWYAFFLVLFFYKKTDRARSGFKGSGLFLLYLLCILMSMFFVGFGVVTKYRAEWYPYAIVRVPEASLLSGPHKKYPVLQVLNYMEEGVVAEKIIGWCRFEVSSGNGSSTGWIEDTEIEIVE